MNGGEWGWGGDDRGDPREGMYHGYKRRARKCAFPGCKNKGSKYCSTHRVQLRTTGVLRPIRKGRQVVLPPVRVSAECVAAIDAARGEKARYHQVQTWLEERAVAGAALELAVANAIRGPATKTIAEPIYKAVWLAAARRNMTVEDLILQTMDEWYVHSLNGKRKNAAR